MSIRLEAALRSDLAMLSLDRHLIDRAQVLYGMRFDKIAASQMAAVAERITTVSNHSDAQRQVIEFLRKQLQKLEDKQKRTGKSASWGCPPSTGGGKETLGATLSDWIQNERYLEGCTRPPDLDALAALQRFWNRFHGLYRYRAELGKGLAFVEPPAEDRSFRET